MDDDGNARIERTDLGFEDHGLLSSYLYLKMDGSGQGFGGFGLGGPFAAIWVERILETVGVDSWEDLPGKYVRYERVGGLIRRIGHIVEDKWFDVRAEFKAIADDPAYQVYAEAVKAARR